MKRTSAIHQLLHVAVVDKAFNSRRFKSIFATGFVYLVDVGDIPVDLFSVFRETVHSDGQSIQSGRSPGFDYDFCFIIGG